MPGYYESVLGRGLPAIHEVPIGFRDRDVSIAAMDGPEAANRPDRLVSLHVSVLPLPLEVRLAEVLREHRLTTTVDGASLCRLRGLAVVRSERSIRMGISVLLHPRCMCITHASTFRGAVTPVHAASRTPSLALEGIVIAEGATSYHPLVVTVTASQCLGHHLAAVNDALLEARLDQAVGRAVPLHAAVVHLAPSARVHLAIAAVDRAEHLYASWHGVVTWKRPLTARGERALKPRSG